MHSCLVNSYTENLEKSYFPELVKASADLPLISWNTILNLFLPSCPISVVPVLVLLLEHCQGFPLRRLFSRNVLFRLTMMTKAFSKCIYYSTCITIFYPCLLCCIFDKASSCRTKNHNWFLIRKERQQSPVLNIVSVIIYM